MICTPSELIDALGGNASVAAKLNVKHNTVSGWRERGLPNWAKPELQRAAADLTVDDELFEIRRYAIGRAA